MNSSTLDLVVIILLFNVIYDLIKFVIHRIRNWSISVSKVYVQASDGNKLKSNVTLDHPQLEGTTVETSRESKTGKLTKVVIIPKYRKEI